jgi:hypothetical protein
MGSRKTRLIVRSDAQISAKVRTSDALAEESMSDTEAAVQIEYIY